MILVTGGAGYIGSVLTSKLLENGYKVRIYDRFFWGRSHLPKHRNLETITGDIRNFDPKNLFAVDAIIHLAALSNDPTAEFNPRANLEINYLATKKLAFLAKSAKIKKFVYASSCSVYYSTIKKSQTILHKEENKISPKAAYSYSKWMSEKALLSMQSKDFSPIILRAGTVYGFSPRMRYDLVVNTMTKDALAKKTIIVVAGGLQWRPIIDIDDLCEAYLLMLKTDEKIIGGQIFNVVFDNFKVRDIAYQVKEALDGNPKVKIEAILNTLKDRSYRVSPAKIEKMLKFKPKKSPKDSIKKMVRLIKKHKYHNFDHPKYYNINWILTLAEINPEIFHHGPII